MPNAKSEYLQYVQDSQCQSAASDSCLVETSYLAVRGDGRQVNVSGVYRWRHKETNDDLLLVHFLITYLRKLRNAYAENPAEFRDPLFNQIDYMVSDAVDRNGALVWENAAGITQGMEQAEMAAFLASAAVGYQIAGDTKLAKSTMTYALRAARSAFMPVGTHTGGICSGEFFCGAKRARFRPACWFHSRGRGIVSNDAHTVLNQHLHVVRDLLSLAVNVSQAPSLVDGAFGSDEKVIQSLVDRSVAGLYQLAFSAGNTSVQRSRPPNIRQFMDFKENRGVRPSPSHPDGNPLDYYWAFYEFDMAGGEGKNISPGGTCHYHTHVLDVFAGIIFTLDRHRALFTEIEDGWQLYEAVDALTQGRGEATGAANSQNALYQFYRSEGPAFKVRRQGCSDKPLSESALNIYSPLFD